MTDITRPGLVALYDIRPGNGAGQFLQPWSRHGAGMGDCLRAGKLSHYVTNHPGQLSLSSFRGR